MTVVSRKTILGCGTALAVLTLATGAMAQQRNFDIPAQEANRAVPEFARQAGVQIIAPGGQLRGIQTKAVRGERDVRAALAIMIQGTGLVVSSDNGTVITLRRAESPQDQGTANGPNEATQVEEVVVTGSHIRNANPTSPVHVLTREDIDQSGYSQVGDLIRSLPENFSGGQNPGVLVGGSNIANQNYSNSSTVNLRGLGTDATLVLVNGHRMAADSAFQGADISGIPLPAVSRIEVVADGASAVYGSDAVAGVVNFVLRKDFDGGLASVRLGGTTEGGGFEQTYSVLQGISRHDWNALVNVEYSKQEEVTTGQREFTSSAYPDTRLLQPQDRGSIFGHFDWDITNRLNFFADVLASDRKSQSLFQYTSDGARYIQDVRTASYTISPTLEYEISESWKVRLSGTAAGSRNSILNQTFYLGAIYPYFGFYRNSVTSIEASADGTLFNVPSGDIKAAVGVGYRDISFKSGYPDQASRLSENENVTYIYGEVQAPLISSSATRTGLHELELSASVRSETYSTFGSKTTPKFGVRYKPFNDLILRGTWGESFKAPSFLQRYQANYVFIANASDFGSSNATQALYVEGGNRDLKPERSDFRSFGAEYSPAWTNGLKFSTTYFDIDYSDRVVNPLSVRKNAFNDPTYAAFLRYYPTLDEQSALIGSAFAVYNFTSASYDPSIVEAVLDNRYSNVTSQTIKGFDFSVTQQFSLQTGDLSFFANATHTILYQKTVPVAPDVKLSGTIYNVPKFKARAGASWESGNWAVTGIINYISSEIDTGVTPSAQIASWTTADATLNYNFGSPEGIFHGAKLAISATNLFDRQPPRARTPGLTIPGIDFDSTNYSVLGRQVSFTISRAW